jgi:HD domain
MPEDDGVDDPVGTLALDMLRPLLLAPILNHSLRTLHLASAECRVSGWDVNPVDLLIACLFHDSGTVPDHSPERFEVAGADRAVEFARAAGRDAPSCRAIWDAIALHTSSGIAERHEPLTRAVRCGVLTDFGSPAHTERHRALINELEQRYPRDGIERVLADAVVAAARTTPSKAPPSSWPAELVRGAEMSTDPGADNPLF